jgi:hypothetical protein
VELPELSFPAYNFKIQSASIPGQSSKIFDIVRKKYVALTPEEWVRQHLIWFLIHEKRFPASLLGVEKKLMVNNLVRRTDLVAYSSALKPLLIAECKAPSVGISQRTFDQAARYNMTLDTSYFVITNGKVIYCCRINREKMGYDFLEDIPDYSGL